MEHSVAGRSAHFDFVAFNAFLHDEPVSGPLNQHRSETMSRPRPDLNRSPVQMARQRALRPRPEALEDRILLYSSLGDKWTYDSRITYSFMPDGTSVGGVPSALFQTLNANYPTATWEQQIEQAATIWETSGSNINLALVSDGGEAVGTAGNQQDDPRFGDIRIGAIPLAAGVLAITFLPPPANGGTDAGDILLNSNINWQINSNYDLMTVVAHEFGHALGLGDESTDSSAVMYGTYNGIKQALDSDDIAGIESIYGTRQFDAYNNGSTHDNSPFTATNLNSKIGSNAQIAVPSLDITTAGDSEWFYVNVPSTTNGKMTVTVQSSNLSSLSPSLAVYNSSLSLVGQLRRRTRWGRRSASRTAAFRPVKASTSKSWRPPATEGSAATACSSTSARRLSRRSRLQTRSSPNRPIREAVRSRMPNSRWGPSTRTAVLTAKARPPFIRRSVV